MDALHFLPTVPAVEHQQQHAQPPAAPSWHTENDAADRAAFREAVVELLKQRKPGASDDWVGRLPLMAVKLEGILYNTAKTREEYLDRSTLKQRLQQVAASRDTSKPPQEGGGGQAAAGAPPTAPPLADTMLSLASVRAAEEENQKRQQVLRHQQQRLIFLRHAYKCPYEHGKCPRTPHCGVFKTLWQHILKCADKYCKTAHCVSSRYLLKHYTDCKDPRCPICGPVRLAIQRNSGEGGGAIGRGVGGGVVTGGAGGPKLQVKFPLDAVSCPLYCFSSEQIANHYKTIHEGARLTVNKIRDICLPVLEDVLKQRWAYQIFGSPVDPVALKLPDYFDIVKVPMDLGTVRKKLDMGVYRSLDHFRSDVMQTFANALMYNPITTDVYSIALDYKQKFEEKYSRMLIAIEDDLKRKRKDPENCGVCGEHKVNFNLDVYWCYGQCGSRIKKNAWYFRNIQHSIYLCKPCFDIQRDPIRTAEASVSKASFGAKLKHDKEEEEPWVQCGICDKWVHMICCLFNNRRNFGDDTAFVCAPCLENMRRRKGSLDGIVAPLTKKIAASDLPHTTLTLFLENRINECLERAYKEASEKQGVPLEEVERCPRVSLRQVSSIDKVQQVKEGVLSRYKHKNYPTEFPFRTKCLVLFQNIDGQDVILFGMYVYEYGHKAPAPNQRRVYISYLDSVYFFRPRQYRTLVYHEVIISYLEYVKLRGFHTAHIWACPPLKGDDYILYCHPTDQKTPRDDQLRKWYQDLLVESKARGIVTEISDIYQEFLRDPTNDATVLPYLDGDYWTNEAEEIIKDLAKGKIQLPDPIAAEIAEIEAVAALESGAGEDDASSDLRGKRSSGANKSKAKAAALAASVGSSRPARSAKAGMPIRPNERDPVMAKLASILEPMKEAFFVARLRPKEYALEKEEQRRLELIEESRQDTEAEVAKKKQALQEEALQGRGMGSEMALPPTQAQAKPDADKEEKEDEEDFCKAVGSINSEKQLESAGSMANLAGFEAQASSQASQVDGSAGGEGEGVSMDVAGENEAKDGEPSDSDSSPRASAARGDSGLGVKRKFDEVQADEQAEVKVEVKAEGIVEGKVGGDQLVITGAGAGGGKQLSFPGTGASQSAAGPVAASDDKKPADSESDISKILDERGIPRCFANMKDDTEDVDETQDSEHFDARTSFLSLCQGNHYQFDQLRRAKHSSMMVLYHLHNPDAPKFTPNCANCRVEINAGYRYHCSACDVNYCTPCLRHFGPGLHQHPLRAMDMSGSAPTQLTEEQKRERERNIQMHMALLVHASSCLAASCPSKSCQKLKDYIKHFNTCAIKAARGCVHCRKVGNLLQHHARTCKEDVCPVPKCLEIRDQFRQAAQRQQNMDDSRRRMMNNMYGRPSTGPEEQQQGGTQDEE